jgi:mycothiol synthase
MPSQRQPFSLRPGTLDDLPEAVAMFNLASREMSDKDEFDLEDYRNEWEDPGIDLEADTRIAQTPDGKIVGCIEVWNTSPYVHCWVWARVHPEFRGQGIGTALMEWAEDRAKVALERAPAGTRVAMSSGCVSTHQPTIDLLTDRGLRPIRHSFTMERDLGALPPAPSWPARITVRAMRPGEELAVYRASQEPFKDHWGHVEQPEEEGFKLWTHRALNDPLHDPSLWFLAMDGAEIVGVSLCQPGQPGDPELGWVDTLGVRRPWRKRGIAEALLYHSFGALYERGRRRVGLGVDSQNLTGALRLYERVGMRPVRQFISFEKDLRAGKDLSTQSIDA